MGLDDIVYLMYTALDNYSSVHMTWRYTTDNARLPILWERAYDEQREAGSGTSEYRYELWWDKAGTMRFDSHRAGRYLRQVYQGERIWWYDATNEVITTNDRQLRADDAISVNYASGRMAPIDEVLLDRPQIDPAFLLAMHEMTIVAETVHDGRPAVDLHSTYRNHFSCSREDHFFAPADRYHLRVDAERGILLRYAAVLDEDEIAVLTIDEVTFDSTFAPEIFHLPSSS